MEKTETFLDHQTKNRKQPNKTYQSIGYKAKTKSEEEESKKKDDLFFLFSGFCVYLEVSDTSFRRNLKEEVPDPT